MMFEFPKPSDRYRALVSIRHRSWLASNGHENVDSNTPTYDQGMKARSMAHIELGCVLTGFDRIHDGQLPAREPWVDRFGNLPPGCDHTFVIKSGHRMIGLVTHPYKRPPKYAKVMSKPEPERGELIVAEMPWPSLWMPTDRLVAPHGITRPFFLFTPKSVAGTRFGKINAEVLAQLVPPYPIIEQPQITTL